MFDTTMIGRKIKQARVDQNMTQMNLADAMGVSYQAVSNWERGNSMPDISKLGDLCEVLHITVNELLGIESPAVTKAMAREDLTVDELTEVAPILPPKTVKEQGKKSGKKLDLSRIAELAPFLDEGDLDELLENADLSELEGLDEIAPFLTKETLEKLVNQVPLDDLEIIVDIAPFLTKAALDKVIRRCVESGEVDDIEELAPFLSKETLEWLIITAIKEGIDLDFEELYPFLSKETLRKLAKFMVENQDLDALEDLVPFL